MRILLKNEEKLSVERYHTKFDCILRDTPRKQYLVPNILFNNMLLSPRASLRTSGDKQGEQENQYS